MKKVIAILLSLLLLAGLAIPVSFAEEAEDTNYLTHKWESTFFGGTLTEETDEDGTYIKTLQGVPTQLGSTLYYSLFADGEGTQTNPFEVANFEQFTCIKYNPYAFYKLKNNIDYNEGTAYRRVFASIPDFYGIRILK